MSDQHAATPAYIFCFDEREREGTLAEELHSSYPSAALLRSEDGCHPVSYFQRRSQGHSHQHCSLSTLMVQRPKTTQRANLCIYEIWITRSIQSYTTYSADPLLVLYGYWMAPDSGTRTRKCVANQSIEVYVVNWMCERKSMALYPSVGSRWKEASTTSEFLADFLLEIRLLAAFATSFGWVREGARKRWPPVHISTKQSTVQQYLCVARKSLARVRLSSVVPLLPAIAAGGWTESIQISSTSGSCSV